MTAIKQILPRAALLLVGFTLLCGVLYTFLVTGIANLVFPTQARGSILVVDGVNYGSELLAQPFEGDGYLWGRATLEDSTRFTDKEGKPLFYGKPSNLSPVSGDYGKQVAERAAAIAAANPDKAGVPVPVDLVTGSGSGMDPGISTAAAEYQIPRLAKSNNLSEEAVQKLIDSCTTPRFLGIFGEETVNVLKVNLLLKNQGE